MLRKIFLGVLGTVLVFSFACKQEKKEVSKRDIALSRIDSLETEIKNSLEKQHNPEISLAMHAIKAYEYYAADFPEDSLSADFLFKAAQIYEGVLNDYGKSIETYSKIYSDFPEYPKRPMALFHQGNLYHSIQDTATAVQIFKMFIEKYPSHSFADDAEAMIRFIRMDAKGAQDFFQKEQDKAKK